MTLNSKTNIFFYFSITFFIVTCIFYTHTKHTIAIGTGSGGGRISATALPRLPDCTPQICNCNITFLAILAQAGGTVMSICPLLSNTPNTGAPLTMASIGWQVMGNFTQTDDLMVSINWGTSL